MANKKTTSNTQKSKQKEEIKEPIAKTTPKITAQIDKLVDYEGGKVRAFASATIGDSFAVHGIRVMDSDNGLYVAMPSRSFQKDGKTEYSDVFHPISSDARNELNDEVLKAYDQKMQEEMEEGQTEDLEEENAPVEQKM